MCDLGLPKARLDRSGFYNAGLGNKISYNPLQIQLWRSQEIRKSVFGAVNSTVIISA